MLDESDLDLSDLDDDEEWIKNHSLSSSDCDGEPAVAAIPSSSSYAVLPDVENEESDDDVPLATRAKRLKADKVAATLSWRKSRRFDNHRGPEVGPAHFQDHDDWSTEQFFLQYYPESFFERIAFCMNYNYQLAHHKSLNVTPDELKIFVGIVILMGNLKFPRIRMYWSGKFRVEAISQKMTRDRFFTIRSNLKFVVDSEISDEKKNKNRLWKVQPILDNFRNICLQLPRDRNCSIDEQMIPFQGMLTLKQHVPNKPNPVGLKNFVLASSSGLILDFQIYQGATTLGEQLVAHGLSAGIVLRLSETLPEGTYLYFDRFFSSVKLLDMLAERKINATGTIMKNRLGANGPTLFTETEMKRKGRGTSVMSVRSDRKVAVTQWYDNKVVLLSSNCKGIEEETEVKRYDKRQGSYVQVKCPQVVSDYNTYMGGVDLVDRMVSYYRFETRTKNGLCVCFIILWMLH